MQPLISLVRSFDVQKSILLIPKLNFAIPPKSRTKHVVRRIPAIDELLCPESMGSFVYVVVPALFCVGSSEYYHIRQRRYILNEIAGGLRLQMFCNFEGYC